MTDKLTSLLVNKQLPEFIREEYPKFISFLEAYYEFLEQKQTGQQNDLIEESKKLRNISDVDESLSEFEEEFFKMFMPSIPKETLASKDFIIKNIMPLYLAKGSEKSYRLLFRMLFDEPVDVTYPKNNVLRASDGRWIKENILRVGSEIYSTTKVTTTNQTEFNLPYVTPASKISVYVDDILVTNYIVRPESKKIIFDAAVSLNSTVKIYFLDFNTTFLENQKVLGLTSGASAIIENILLKKSISTNYYEFSINKKTILGNFNNEELLEIQVYIDDKLFTFVVQAFSDLLKIDVTYGGYGYNVGDPVIIRGESTRDAIAVVGSIATGELEKITVENGGIGFTLGDNVIAVGFDPSALNASVEAISSVDAAGKINSLNVLSFNIDIISNYQSINISDPDYGFPTGGTENVNTVIANALTMNTVIMNVITSVVITSTIIDTTSVTFNVTPRIAYANTNLFDLGAIGTLKIDNAGQNYQIGDKLIFNQGFSGANADGYVKTVSGNGEILSVVLTSGGLNYKVNDLPSIAVQSANGTNAVLSVEALVGDGEVLSPFIGVFPPGYIFSITLLDPGFGYANVPTIDLSQSGSGLEGNAATAVATIRPAFIELPGKWKTMDGIISTDEMRLQGRDYYIDYSYVLNSKVEFRHYKNILKNLLHPAGLVSYYRYQIFDDINQNLTLNVSASLAQTVSGTVNTNSSIYIVGTNTKFVLANTRGTIEPGSNVAINSQVRTINTVLSNTVITVTSPFTINTNGQRIVVLN